MGRSTLFGDNRAGLRDNPIRFGNEKELVFLMDNNTKKLRELLEGSRFCMFTTRGKAGLQSRPMALQQLDDAACLWFFTRKNNDLGEDIANDEAVNLSIAEKGKYVSISGRAFLVEDRQKAEALWSMLYRAWYPKGIDDPDLQLLKVEAEHVAYWESPESAASVVYAAVKATLTGKEVEMGEHGELHLPKQV